jgi:hypothetical protein
MERKTFFISIGVCLCFLGVSGCGRLPTPTIAQPTRNLPATETIIARNIFATITVSAQQTSLASETVTPGVQATSAKSATFTATIVPLPAVTRVPTRVSSTTPLPTATPNPMSALKYDLVKQECTDSRVWDFPTKVIVESDNSEGVRVRLAAVPDGTDFWETVTGTHGDASFTRSYGVVYVWIVDQNGIRVSPISAPIMFKTESCTFSTVYFRKK